MSHTLDHVNEAFQQQRNFVTLEELSLYSNSGIEYASAILYSLSLGLRVVGKIPPWIMKLTRSPKSVHPNLVSGVRRELSTVGIILTDDGQLLQRNQRWTG